MSTSKVLDGAADALVERGWIQGDYTPPLHEDSGTCPVCVVAALNIADGKAPDTRLCGDALVAAFALADQLGIDLDDHPGVPANAAVELLGDDWNDSARSVDEVIGELRAAAQREREAGR